MNVRDNRYQILPTAKDIKVNKDAFVNILSLDDVTEEDNGTYICFVAKNGLNSLTFKSATVFVMPGNIHYYIALQVSQGPSNSELCQRLVTLFSSFILMRSMHKLSACNVELTIGF